MGPTPRKMLSGFNHNIRLRGKTYHVQTEDGGHANPTIKTHVYLGGVILDSVEWPYEDILERSRWQDALKARMKIQHLEEIRRLLAGEIIPCEEEPGDR
ncbi:MAG: hypothetical protein AB1346_12860 [Thermodesulfobacteriota bacterium]